MATHWSYFRSLQANQGPMCTYIYAIPTRYSSSMSIYTWRLKLQWMMVVVFLLPQLVDLQKKGSIYYHSPFIQAQWLWSSSWWIEWRNTLNGKQQFHSLGNYSVCNKRVHSSKGTFVLALLFLLHSSPHATRLWDDSDATMTSSEEQKAVNNHPRRING